MLGLAVYLGVTLLTLHLSIESTDGRADLVSGDAGHYLTIADTFSKGDFSMDYVRSWPHRQPLYPALLAGVSWSGSRDALHDKIDQDPHGVTDREKSDLFSLSLVNVLLAGLGFLTAYFGVLWVFSSRVAAAVVGLLYITNSFLLAQTTRHLLTEPLHIFLMMGIILSFFAFLRQGKAWTLLLATVAGGLDYLARPNGLFVTAALFGALICADLWLIVTRRHEMDGGVIARRLGLYALCGVVFGILTIPSWLPRQCDFGNPIYAGYLNNYLWVDTYKQAHVTESGPRYHAKDYFSTHTAGDFVVRWLKGIWNVCFDIPWRTEDRKPVLYLFAWAGVLLTIFRGPPACRVVLLFGTVQLLPLIWTNMSNPNLRVPYASTLPFELFFAAVFLVWLGGEEARTLWETLRQRWTRKSP